MKELLFTYTGRLNRGKFFLALLYQLILALIAGAVLWVLSLLIPGDVTPDGGYSVTGLRAVPLIVVGLAYTVVSFWSGLCVGIKRYHDRGKSGLWLLIMLVPMIGALWYLIETAFLRGTIGPNQYGPDPVPAT